MDDDRINYKIEIKDIPAVHVATIRYKGKYNDFGKYFGKIYKVIKGDTNGKPFNCYFDDEYKEEADIESCVPTSKQSYDSEVITKELPQIRAMVTLHNGTYESINIAYKAILDYVVEKNINRLMPSREIYIKGPGMIFKGNPNNYITEIIIPINLDVDKSLQ